MQMRDYLEQSSRTADAEPRIDLTIIETEHKLLHEMTNMAIMGLTGDFMKRTLFYRVHKGLDDYYSKELDRVNELSKAIDTTGEINFISDEINMIHAILGIQSELSELTEALVGAVTSGKRIDVVNVKEEAGDILWYTAMLLRAIGSSFEEAAQSNIDKLKVRYPEKFETHQAVNRDRAAERAALEGNA